MTTREIYFKIVYEADGFPQGRIGYVYKDTKGIIQIGANICLELRTNKEVAKKSINKMKEIEKTNGFIFWVNSPEGEEFITKNSKEIGIALMNELRI